MNLPAWSLLHKIDLQSGCWQRDVADAESIKSLRAIALRLILKRHIRQHAKVCRVANSDVDEERHVGQL